MEYFLFPSHPPPPILHPPPSTSHPPPPTTLLSSSPSVVPKLSSTHNCVLRRIDPGHGAQGTHLWHCERATQHIIDPGHGAQGTHLGHCERATQHIIDPGHGAQVTHLGHCERATHTPWTCTTEQLHIPTALASSFTFTLSALSIPEQQNTSGSNTNLSETTIPHVKQTLGLVATPSLVSRPLPTQYLATPSRPLPSLWSTKYGTAKKQGSATVLAATAKKPHMTG